MTSKAKLRRRADKLYFEHYLQPHCEVCNMEARQLHHYFTKGLYGHLRYDPNNLISLCMSCHFRLHHRGDVLITETIKEKRGMKWYKSLVGKAQRPPLDYQITTKFYNDAIKKIC